MFLTVGGFARSLRVGLAAVLVSLVLPAAASSHVRVFGVYARDIGSQIYYSMTVCTHYPVRSVISSTKLVDGDGDTYRITADHGYKRAGCPRLRVVVEDTYGNGLYYIYPTVILNGRQRYFASGRAFVISG